MQISIELNEETFNLMVPSTAKPYRTRHHHASAEGFDVTRDYFLVRGTKFGRITFKNDRRNIYLIKGTKNEI
jgi:hypothetical protein